MASVSQPPIQSNTEFQRALTEVERLLETPPAPESLEDRWFNHLLVQIAEYNDNQPRAEREANSDRLEALNRHLQAYGKRWPGYKPHPEDHWAPLVGWDLHSTHRH